MQPLGTIPVGTAVLIKDPGGHWDHVFGIIRAYNASENTYTVWHADTGLKRDYLRGQLHVLGGHRRSKVPLPAGRCQECGKTCYGDFYATAGGGVIHKDCQHPATLQTYRDLRPITRGQKRTKSRTARRKGLR